MKTSFAKLAVLGALICISADAFSDIYPVGHVWSRWKDWTLGGKAGSIKGNPDDDSRGNPVWLYGNSKGGDLYGNDPWFKNHTQLQFWDDYWAGTVGNVAWARKYIGATYKVDANPPISRMNMIHDLSENTKSWIYIPVVKWINPAGDGALVNITGQAYVTWNGHKLIYSPDVDIDVVVAKYDHSSSGYEVIYQKTVSNPQANQPYTGVVKLNLDFFNFSNIRVDQGDEIIFSLRGKRSPIMPSTWVGLTDDKLSITLSGYIK